MTFRLITYNILNLAEVLSEDSILKWYKDAHSPKGKMHFLQQMKKFIEWLQNAEEGKFSLIFILKIKHQLEQYFSLMR